jgi:hypothetical protein
MRPKTDDKNRERQVRYALGREGFRLMKPVAGGYVIYEAGTKAVVGGHLEGGRSCSMSLEDCEAWAELPAVTIPSTAIPVAQFCGPWHPRRDLGLVENDVHSCVQWKSTSKYADGPRKRLLATVTCSGSSCARRVREPQAIAFHRYLTL